MLIKKSLYYDCSLSELGRFISIFRQLHLVNNYEYDLHIDFFTLIHFKGMIIKEPKKGYWQV